uniref:(northern house mosquito) hypothetical protein n=1 Tax=Culex pipiens TaxID=7175 RepID=A0A8D8MEM6_CULPI
MGREPSNTKMDSHKTERFLRRITMLMRLQRIKARMATSSASSRPPPPAILPSRDRQRSASTSASSQRPSVAPVPSLALSSVLQRSGRTSVVLHSERQQRSEASSKRSLRFSHRRRQSEQVRRQLERQAGSEQQPTARVRVVAVVMVPHRGGRQSSGSSRSSRRRSRRSQARELPGRPHVLNLVRRLLGRVESMAATPEEDTNGGRIFVSQAQNERTPEKGNQSGEGDDQKTG